MPGTVHQYAHGFCNARHLRELTCAYEQEKALWAQEMSQLLLQIKEQVEQAKAKRQSTLSRSQLGRFRQCYRDISQEALELYPVKPQKKKRGRPQADGKTLDCGVNMRFLAHDHKEADLPD